MDGPLGYKRVDKLNYTHLPQQKLTKCASCQLCRFIGEPEDKFQKVKSNIAYYCSDCNVHLCIKLLQTFSLSGGYSFGWCKACMAYVLLFKKRGN